jgi:hypothetical protein
MAQSLASAETHTEVPFLARAVHVPRTPRSRKANGRRIKPPMAFKYSLVLLR